MTYVSLTDVQHDPKTKHPNEFISTDIVSLNTCGGYFDSIEAVSVYALVFFNNLDNRTYNSIKGPLTQSDPQQSTWSLSWVDRSLNY